MRLISGFKDYYDSYAKNRMFSDLSYNRTWKRETTVVPSAFSLPAGMRYRDIPIGFRINAFTIHFCGTEIPVIRVVDYYAHEDYFIYLENGCVTFPYGLDKISQILKTSLHFQKEITGFADLQNRLWVKTDISGKQFKRIPNVEMHRILNTPVFLSGCFGNSTSYTDQSGRMSGSTLEVLKDPVLQDLGFDKYMKPLDCFTRIEQFVCNDLVVPDKVDIKIPDALKVESHGFDKHSFRKDKRS